MEITASLIIKKWLSGEQPPNLVVLTGEEFSLRQQVLENLLDLIFLDVREEDREIIKFSDDLDWMKISTAVNSYPIFSGHSVIIIECDKLFEAKKNGKHDLLSKKTEQLEKILADIPKFCTIVLVSALIDKRTKIYKYLIRQATVVLCEPIKPRELSQWLRDKAKSLGGSFDDSGIGQIVAYLDQVDKIPLDILEKEIDKLVAVVGTDRPWNDRDVEKVFSDLPELGNFKLLDSIEKRNVDLFIKYLRIEVSKTKLEMDKLIGGLRYRLRMMILVLEYHKIGNSRQEIIKKISELGFNAWKLENIIDDVINKFDLGELMWAYKEIGKLNSNKREMGFSAIDFYSRLEDIFMLLLSKNLTSRV